MSWREKLALSFIFCGFILALTAILLGYADILPHRIAMRTMWVGVAMIGVTYFMPYRP